MKHIIGAVALTVVVMFGLVAAPSEAANPVLKSIESEFVQLHDQLNDIVVNIDTKVAPPETEAGLPEGYEELFRFFNMPFQSPDGGMPRFHRPPRMAQGSGFIYDTEGHIVTNNHVVDGAQKIVVKFADGTEEEATVVGKDKQTDIAVIKVEPRPNMRCAKLGDSNKLKVGQFAIAVGSARGLESTFSYGHISALGRNHLNLPGLRFEDFIQTDAAINLGNSGGPLCNIDGEVIGINVAIVYGANSLGFAIPSNTAKDIVPKLIKNQKVTRGFLGVNIQPAKDFAAADQLALPDKTGAIVSNVVAGSPAEEAGIKPYDVIRKVNGEIVEDSNDLLKKISAIEPQSIAVLEVWRDKEPIEMKVALAEFSEEAFMPKSADLKQDVLGIRVEDLTPELMQRLGIENTTGVVVVDVEPNSPAEDAGLTQGLVITNVAKQPIANAQEFVQSVKDSAAPGKHLLLSVIRPGGLHDIVMIRVPDDAEVK